MTDSQDVPDIINDVLSAAKDAQEFIAGMDVTDFQADRKTIFAVVRALEILGEATKRLSNDLRERYPAIPWRSMAGIRDRLIHDVPRDLVLEHRLHFGGGDDRRLGRGRG